MSVSYMTPTGPSVVPSGPGGGKYRTVKANCGH